MVYIACQAGAARDPPRSTYCWQDGTPSSTALPSLPFGHRVCSSKIENTFSACGIVSPCSTRRSAVAHVLASAPLPRAPASPASLPAAAASAPRASPAAAPARSVQLHPSRPVRLRSLPRSRAASPASSQGRLLPLRRAPISRSRSPRSVREPVRQAHDSGQPPSGGPA